MSARSFLDEVREKLAELNEKILNHPYIVEAEKGVLPKDKIGEFLRQQYYIVSHDARSLALMASRSQDTYELEFFLDLAKGDLEGLKALVAMATSIGLSEDELLRAKPLAEAVAYTHYLSWLALYGNPGEQAFAMIVNLPVWGANCRRLAKALREKYGFTNTSFLDVFSEPMEPLEERALPIIEKYLEKSRDRMLRIAEVIQRYEYMFWDALYKV